MPIIHRVRCDQCGFAHEGAASALFARRDDGAEVICAHPLEDRIARRFTHRKWDDLRRAGCIRSRLTMFCAACGELGWYGEDAGQQDATGQRDAVLRRDLSEDERYGHLHFAPADRILRLTDEVCAACEAAQLHPLNNEVREPPRAWHQELRDLLSWRYHLQALKDLMWWRPSERPAQEAVLCPRCHEGCLNWAIVGIS